MIDRIEAMNLRGRTREQIELLLANESRAELLDRIFSLVTVEPLFEPSEIAARSCVNKRKSFETFGMASPAIISSGQKTPLRCRQAASTLGGIASASLPGSKSESFKQVMRNHFSRDGYDASHDKYLCRVCGPQAALFIVTRRLSQIDLLCYPTFASFCC